jgi:hypothetical protein
MSQHVSPKQQGNIDSTTGYISADVRDYFSLHVIQNGIIWPYELKKCCKKYKKGNRCKKCPNN